MQLVEKHIIKKSNKLYAELDKMCFLSKNLYNYALYRIRQHYFESKKYLNYVSLAKQLSAEKQIDYISLPIKVSQWVVKQVDQNFRSFFASLKSKKVAHKVSIPKYKDKNGRNLLTFTNQAVSTKELKNNYLKLSGCENKIKIIHTSVNQVKVVHKGNFIEILVIYSVEEKTKLADNGNYVGIDLGINNLATIGGNLIKPFIINGRPLKSINQYYNKKLAKLKSRQDACKNKNVNRNKIKSLTNKRNNKINDYLHKSSRLLVNQLVSNQVSKVVIGHNKEWKQDINIGNVNNQKFVQIPFNRFIQMVTYKCMLEGIEVIQREESYTSKCSFLDGEEICKHDSYLGKRIKRGLFRPKSGKLINADLNGALNILRKEVPNIFKEYSIFLENYGIEACSRPAVLTVK